MANDIPILSIQPQQGGVAPSQVVTQGAGSQGQVVLPKLPAGTVLSGFIVNRDAAGNPILRTDSGDITFTTPFFLNIGSEVVIRLENHAGTLTANLLSVDGQPPEVAAGQSVFAQTEDVVVSPDAQQPQTAPTTSTSQTAVAQIASPPPNALPPPTISGTLIAPAPPTPQSQNLPAGTQLNFQILSVSTPPGTVAPEAITPTAVVNPALYAAYQRNATPAQIFSAATPAAVPAPANIPTAPAPTVAAPVLPQTETAATQTPTNPIVAPTIPAPAPVASTNTPTPTPIPVTDNTAVVVSQPQAASAPVPTSTSATPSAPASSAPVNTTTPAPPTPTPTAGSPIVATVIGHAATGAALAQTPYGIVELQPDISLPQGSTLVLAVVQTTPPQTASAAATAEANTLQAPILELARQWTSLQQLIQQLTDSPPPGATHATLPALLTTFAAPQSPLAPEDISSGLMLFMAALRGNDFSNWLGKENINWLESQGLGSIIHKAEGEFNLLARQYGDTQTQSWRTLFFPVATGGEWQQVRLFVKRDRKQQSGGQGKKGEGTRFVVEMDLSQLGPMQMDGLVHKHEQNMQFDLFIRSKNALPANVQQDILTIYTNIGELTGYKGNLLFQAVKEFPVNPMEDVMAQAQGSVMA